MPKIALIFDLEKGNRSQKSILGYFWGPFQVPQKGGQGPGSGDGAVSEPALPRDRSAAEDARPAQGRARAHARRLEKPPRGYCDVEQAQAPCVRHQPGPLDSAARSGAIPRFRDI